jgi:hypothetical protein
MFDGILNVFLKVVTVVGFLYLLALITAWI